MAKVGKGNGSIGGNGHHQKKTGFHLPPTPAPKGNVGGMPGSKGATGKS